MTRNRGKVGWRGTETLGGENENEEDVDATANVSPPRSYATQACQTDDPSPRSRPRSVLTQPSVHRECGHLGNIDTQRACATKRGRGKEKRGGSKEMKGDETRRERR
ncbi:hypothetical protein PAXINDRAFT_20410 [Paxillus involutus ATCC 200175]|uniref:Uncharacterized protein n=1 Tax=Paxillus involutus ATCC 200175 TaxID=664439 RepID=A0A0C9TDW7_PAXIN|nr:hypothetical protein PAXINDRAFT_20410 [Paxillus involutus ATCC 200175]